MCDGERDRERQRERETERERESNWRQNILSVTTSSDISSNATSRKIEVRSTRFFSRCLVCLFTAGKTSAEFRFVCCSMRQDVFDSMLAAQKNLGDSLQGEAKRYLERLIKLGRRNGESPVS